MKKWETGCGNLASDILFKHPRANKKHPCMNCKKTIDPGKHYYKEQGRFLEELTWVMREVCEDCHSKGLYPPRQKKIRGRKDRTTHSLDEFGDKR